MDKKEDANDLIVKKIKFFVKENRKVSFEFL